MSEQPAYYILEVWGDSHPSRPAYELELAIRSCLIPLGIDDVRVYPHKPRPGEMSWRGKRD